MAYHFPATTTTATAVAAMTSTATSSSSSAAAAGSSKQLKGVHNAIVHLVLHGEKLCTLQQTFSQFEGNKLANKYGSNRWSASIEAELDSDGYIIEEFDYYCYRKLVNVMRLRAMMRSPYCKLPTDTKQKCPSAVPTTKKGALSWMLAHFMITKDDFNDSFASGTAADTTSSNKRKR
jgi:hypothetical protein